MDGRKWARGSDPSAKAFGLVTKKLMGVGRGSDEGPAVRNPGARWWRDPQAVRDKDLVIQDDVEFLGGFGVSLVEASGSGNGLSGRCLR